MHLRRNDLDSEESGALGMREWGWSPPGPCLSQIISFGITDRPLTCPGIFTIPAPPLWQAMKEWAWWL